MFLKLLLAKREVRAWVRPNWRKIFPCNLTGILPCPNLSETWRLSCQVTALKMFANDHDSRLRIASAASSNVTRKSGAARSLWPWMWPGSASTCSRHQNKLRSAPFQWKYCSRGRSAKSITTRLFFKARGIGISSLSIAYKHMSKKDLKWSVLYPANCAQSMSHPTLVEPDLALHQSLPEPSPEPCWTWLGFAPRLPGTFSGTFSGSRLNLTWLCTKASQTFSGTSRNLLRNPVEPDLALHQGFLEPSPEPFPEAGWTWPGCAPKPPRPSPEPSGTFSGTSLNLTRRLHQCTPELFWVLAYAVGEKNTIPPFFMVSPGDPHIYQIFPNKTSIISPINITANTHHVPIISPIKSGKIIPSNPKF